MNLGRLGGWLEGGANRLQLPKARACEWTTFPVALHLAWAGRSLRKQVAL